MARIVAESGEVLVADVAVSKAFEKGNARGLLGRDGLRPGEGVLLRDPTGSIHMFFMKFAIDAVFLTDDLRVVKIAHHLKPWRLARAGGARRILEIGAGEAARLGIEPGQTLRIEE